MASPAFSLDFLRGTEISSARLQDNASKVISQIGVIAKGQLAENVVINVPPALPASVTVPNPLGRAARGAIIVKQNQALWIAFQDSTASTLTLLVTLVPVSVNGVISGPGLSGLTGTTTCSIWVF